MLSLIGLGLNDEKDLTLKGIEAAKKAEKVYIEQYTGVWHGSLKKLEKIVGKKIFVLKRKDLEDDAEKILNEAKKIDVAIFVQGDPLVATTHNALILEAKRKKIKTKIIHNSSIISAIAETGLHIYKFGQTVTIPFPEKTKGALPESVYEVLKENRKRKLHTLCLLDIDSENKRFMLPQEAVRILLELEKKRNENVFTEKTNVLAIGKLGSEKPIMEYRSAKDMLNSYFRVYPSVMIIPGELHFTEKEFLL
ncbi:MAG TPA: diphthine synthase [archaeon]|nr:diphthine synthase [archaeon]